MRRADDGRPISRHAEDDFSFDGQYSSAVDMPRRTAGRCQPDDIGDMTRTRDAAQPRRDDRLYWPQSLSRADSRTAVEMMILPRR